MTSFPSVACVIPTHARDESLRRALQSVADQSVLPSSVTVVDDVGSASTRTLVEQFRDTLSVHYVDAGSMSERGAGASRNLGALASPPSVFLAFLDDDDYWDAEYLEQTLTRGLDARLGLITTWARMQRGNRFYPHAWRAGTGFEADEILARNPGITGSNLVVRRSLFDAIGGFDSGQWVFNDLDFVIRCLDAGAVYDVVPIDLVTQTAEPGEHLSSRSDRRADGISRYIGLYRHRLVRHQLRILRRQQAVARLHPGQSRLGRLRYGATALWNASPSDYRRALGARLSRDRGYE